MMLAGLFDGESPRTGPRVLAVPHENFELSSAPFYADWCGQMEFDILFL